MLWSDWAKRQQDGKQECVSGYAVRLSIHAESSLISKDAVEHPGLPSFVHAAKLALARTRAV